MKNKLQYYVIFFLKMKTIGYNKEEVNPSAMANLVNSAIL